jgi:glycosyltransferase involved in cell wall biosynthesis
MIAFPDYVNELQELAHHPGIKFAGRIPHKQLWEALAEADVVVVPSLWYETAVLVIQEAFAAGVPVIVSQIGALQERVNDGSNGLLFPPGDAAALRDILLNLHDSPVHLAALRRGITAQTTIDQHLDKIIKIYQSCLDQL